MVRRHAGAAFLAGADVFPGGRVEEADRVTPDDRWCDGIAQAAAQLDDLPPHEAVAYHLAAVREMFEEAGILLARDDRGGSSSSPMAGVRCCSRAIAALFTRARDRCAT